MRTLLKELFLDQWLRKLFALMLSILTWYVVNQSLTTTKTIGDIPIQIEGLPKGKTIEGIDSHGVLKEKINLTLTGKKTLLEKLSSRNIEIVIDARGHEKTWDAVISKKNLISESHDTPLTKEIQQGVDKVLEKSIEVKLSNLASEKIPVYVTHFGNAPKGYKLISIWPYQLSATIEGPEEVVNRLKAEGQKLILNLDTIDKQKLENLHSETHQTRSEIVSFPVPNGWKTLSIPSLSNHPITIDDPLARDLRIDFIRSKTLPLKSPIPLSLFSPPSSLKYLSPKNFTIDSSSLTETENGMKLLKLPLYAKGVDKRFLAIIKDHLQMCLVITQEEGVPKATTSLQFIEAKKLEENYVNQLIADTSDRKKQLEPNLRQEYLRNRFRSYMQSLQLYKTETDPLHIKVEVKGNSITLIDKHAHDAP